jgi:hypothetical protein
MHFGEHRADSRTDRTLEEQQRVAEVLAMEPRPVAERETPPPLPGFCLSTGQNPQTCRPRAYFGFSGSLTELLGDCFSGFSSAPLFVGGVDLWTENTIHCPLKIGSSAGSQPPSVIFAIGCSFQLFSSSPPEAIARQKVAERLEGR